MLSGVSTVVIIPAFNEGPRIGAVVSSVVAAGYDVLVVDDGSKDDTAAQAEASGARVLVLPKNGGKGNAMLAGVEATDADVIMFLDGDMKGFDAASLHAMSDPVESGDYDQMIGVSGDDHNRRFGDSWEGRLIISGQRALRREFLEMLPPEAWDGYGIEVWLNDVVARHGGKSGVFLLDGVRASYKWEKEGAAKGLAKMADMGAQIFRALQRIIVHYESASPDTVVAYEGTMNDVAYQDAPVPATLEAQCSSTECVADALTKSAARALWTPDVQERFSKAVSREIARPLWVGVSCVSYLLAGPAGAVAAGAGFLMSRCDPGKNRRPNLRSYAQVSASNAPQEES